MAIERKTYKFIFFTALVLLAGFAIWYFFLREPDCDPNRNGYDKNGNPNSKCKIDNPQNTNTPPPSGSQWIPDTSFPLKRGSWGPRVKAWQKAIGLSSSQQDGKFGPITEGATQKKIGLSTVDEATYNNLVNANPNGSPNVGKYAYAINDGTEVYNQSDYSLYRTFAADEFIGKIIPNSPSTSSLNYTINGGYIVPVADVYIK